jgi:hypothetical protein
MKIARTYIKYLYTMRRHPADWANWHGEGNIGDAIQCIAVEQLLADLGVSPETLVRINRDALPEYAGEPCILPMNGWFGYFADIFPFPWAKGITPFFTGFHLTPTWESHERFIQAGIPALMKPWQPIGCRDRSTMLFLRSRGLHAYLSGCLTLTLPGRETFPEDSKIFIVDIPDEIKARFPRRILDAADESITHFHYFRTYPVTEEEALEFENKARLILDRYRTEARLIITSRIHAALPCLAMGIPVIFISDKEGDDRFDVLTGLIPIFRGNNLEAVNWNPEPISVEFVRTLQKKAFASAFHALAAPRGINPGTNPVPLRAEMLDSFELETDRRQLDLSGIGTRIAEYELYIARYQSSLEQRSGELLTLIDKLQNSRRWKTGNTIVNFLNFFRRRKETQSLIDNLRDTIFQLRYSAERDNT